MGRHKLERSQPGGTALKAQHNQFLLRTYLTADRRMLKTRSADTGHDTAMACTKETVKASV